MFVDLNFFSLYSLLKNAIKHENDFLAAFVMLILYTYFRVKTPDSYG